MYAQGFYAGGPVKNIENYSPNRIGSEGMEQVEAPPNSCYEDTIIYAEGKFIQQPPRFQEVKDDYVCNPSPSLHRTSSLEDSFYPTNTEGNAPPVVATQNDSRGNRSGNYNLVDHSEFIDEMLRQNVRLTNIDEHTPSVTEDEPGPVSGDVVSELIEIITVETEIDTDAVADSVDDAGSDKDAEGEIDMDIEITSISCEDIVTINVDNVVEDVDDKSPEVSDGVLTQIDTLSCTYHQDGELHGTASDVGNLETQPLEEKSNNQHDSPSGPGSSETLSVDLEQDGGKGTTCHELVPSRPNSLPSGVPMPVSADPTVPDPTSRSPSPPPNGSQQTIIDNGSLDNINSTEDPPKLPRRASAILPPAVFKSLQLNSMHYEATSFRGLFTPSLGSTPGDVTPVVISHGDERTDNLEVTEAIHAHKIAASVPETFDYDDDSIASSSPDIPLESLPALTETNLQTASQDISSRGADQDPPSTHEDSDQHWASQYLNEDQIADDFYNIPGLGPITSQDQSPLQEIFPLEHEVAQNASFTSFSSPQTILPHFSYSASQTIQMTAATADPILRADPYPYSLSTPGVEPLKEDISEEETDISISSSSTNINDKESTHIPVDENDHPGSSFLYASDDEELYAPVIRRSVSKQSNPSQPG